MTSPMECWIRDSSVGREWWTEEMWLDSLQGQTSFLVSKASGAALKPSTINEYRRFCWGRGGGRGTAAEA